MTFGIGSRIPSSRASSVASESFCDNKDEDGLLLAQVISYHCMYMLYHDLQVANAESCSVAKNKHVTSACLVL